MPGQPTPPLIQEPFAKNAAAPYIQNPIPLTTGDDKRASFDLGFPPKTMTEIFAGGTPPFGQDVNGILFMTTSHIAALQAGQPYLYNSTLATAMGGYMGGVVLGMADGSGLWLNIINGNVTNPDGGAASGWVPLFSQGFATMPPSTGGVVTLTAAQYRRRTIVLSGTLAGNLQVVLPSGPIGQQSWLVINTTTGAFTTTVKTAAGTGVVIPQGGFQAPVGVYGDGTNIYPSVAPVNLPIDQAANPLTIVQRTNVADVFVRYLNSNNPIDNFGMAAVYADAGDGYLRKISPANFAAQISLPAFAGAVANAQVPLSAVMQYVANILASAALTGAPTAPTQGVGNNSTAVATTAFVMSQALGNAQGWTNVGRALNTPVVNSTGRALMVAFTGDCRRSSAGGGAFNGFVDGVAVGTLLAAGSTDMSAQMSFVVPPGSTYQVNQGGAFNGYTWSELA